MGKEKIEKIIFLILLPVFALALISRFTGRIKQTTPVAPVSVTQEQQEYPQAQAKVPAQPQISLKKVKYNAGKVFDPLKDRLFAYIVSKMKEKKPEVAIKPPQLNITGLIWNSDRPQAIINGNVLSAGDEIGEVKLLSVDKKGVKIEYKGSVFFIKR